MDEVTQKVEAVLLFAADLETRMSGAGFAGVVGLIEQFGRLRDGLDRVRGEELDWATGEVRALIERLEGVARTVEQLRQAKRALEGVPAGPPPRA